MIRVIWRICLLILLLIAIAVGAILLLVSSEKGSARLWSFAQTIAGEEITLGSISGPLTSPFTVTGIAVQNDAMSLTVNQVEVHWDLTELLDKTLDMDQLKVEGVNFRKLETQAAVEQTPFDITTLKLPVAIEIGKASLSAFRFESGALAQPIIIDNLVFGASLNPDELALKNTRLGSPQGNIDANINLNLTNSQVTGLLSWEAILADYPAVAGNAELSGSLDQMNIEWKIQEPYSLTGFAKFDDALKQASADIVINDIDVTLSRIQETLPDTKVRGFVKIQSDIAANKTQFQSALAITDAPEIGAVKTAIDGVLENDQIQIRQWRIRPDDLETQIDASGKISLKNNKDIDLAINWKNLQWPLRAEPIFASHSGQTTVTGTLSSLQIQLLSEVNRPLLSNQATANVQLDLSQSSPIIVGKIEIPGLRYPHTGDSLIDQADANLSIKGQLPHLQANLELNQVDQARTKSINVGGDIDLTNSGQPHVDLTGRWANLQWPLKVTAEEDTVVQSKQGDFSITGTPASIKAEVQAGVNESGTINANVAYDPENVSLKANWQNLEFRNRNQLFQSEKGVLSLTGVPDNYAFSLNSDAMVDDKSVSLDARGIGNQSSMKIEKIVTTVLEGSVNGNANIDWSDGIAADVNITVKNLNPGQWWLEWPGQINGQIVGSARSRDSVVEVNGLNVTLDGELREFPINAALSAEKSADSVTIHSLNLRSAETLVTANGSYTDKLDFNWEIDSADLSSVHPLASGNLKANGSLSGDPKLPAVNATISGSDVRYDQNVLNRIAGEFTVDSTDNSPSAISLAFNGQVAGVEIKDASIIAEGLTKNHRMLVFSETDKGQLEATLNNRMRSISDWEMDLAEAKVELPELGQWTLTGPATGVYNAPSFTLSSICFNSEESNICIDGELREGAVTSNFEFDNLTLARLTQSFAENMVVEGAVSGRGSIKKLPDSDPVGIIRINSTSGEIRSTSGTEEDSIDQFLAFDKGELEVQLNPGKAEASFLLPLGGEDLISASGTLTGQSPDWAKRALSAELNTEITSIEFLQRFLPGVGKLAGSVNGNMGIGGSISQPEFLGSIELKNAATEIAATETYFENINILLKGDPQAGMDLSGSAESGGGELKLSGVVDLSRGTPVADISLKGNRAQVANTATAVVYVSPDIRLQMDDNKIKVSGEIEVPSATITVQSIPRSAIKASSDQVIVVEQESTKKTQIPYQLSANIRTRLGDDVNFSGFGLTGRLGGEVTSIESPDKPSEIRGEIAIKDGKYEAYGQNLSIETGRLLFAGAGATNPSIDLRASRQPTQEVTVGVTARGKLQQPEFTLYSTPSMTDRNKLSYLILGRAADQTSDGEKSQLGQLALALGLKRSSGITGTLGDALGIDTIGVEAEPGTEAEQESFVIGKYLTPKLYLRYGIGLFEPINTLRLQYSLNDSWKIITESSDKASGGDIQYTIDR